MTTLVSHQAVPPTFYNKIAHMPLTLTVMKEQHKDNLQNVTLNAHWMLVKCLQLLPAVY